MFLIVFGALTALLIGIVVYRGCRNNDLTAAQYFGHNEEERGKNDGTASTHTGIFNVSDKNDADVVDIESSA